MSAVSEPSSVLHPLYSVVAVACLTTSFLALRHVYNRRVLLSRRFGLLLTQKLGEEAWTLAFSTFLVVFAWSVQLSPSNPCRITSTAECIWGYPNHPMSSRARAYYISECSYYLFMVLRGPLGLGLEDRGPMHYHHLVSLTLLAASAYLGLHRLGILSLALLSATNPFLHLSRIFNALEYQNARVVAFLLFSVLWVLLRVVVFPLTVLRCVLLEGLPATANVRVTVQGIPFAPFQLVIWGFFSVGLLVLYAFQLYWTAAIFRVLFKLKTEGGEEAGREARGNYEQIEAAHKERRGQLVQGQGQDRVASPSALVPERMLYRVEEEETEGNGKFRGTEALEEDDTGAQAGQALLREVPMPPSPQGWRILTAEPASATEEKKKDL